MERGAAGVGLSPGNVLNLVIIIIIMYAGGGGAARGLRVRHRPEGTAAGCAGEAERPEEGSKRPDEKATEEAEPRRRR